jgi:hypothetical protein
LVSNGMDDYILNNYPLAGFFWLTL